SRCQYLVFWNLCRLCHDHVDLRTNSHWNSYGLALDQRCYDRVDLFLGPTTAELDSWTRGGGQLCSSLCRSGRLGLRRSCRTFCNVTDAEPSAAFIQAIGSTRIQATIRE